MVAAGVGYWIIGFGTAWTLGFAVGWALGRLMGDQMITWPEVKGLSADLLATDAPPAGS